MSDDLDLELSSSKALAFLVSGVPKAQPRVKAFARKMGNRFVARVFTPGTAEEWKSQIAVAAQKHIPATPITGPVRVDLVFYMPRPKSHFRGKTKALRWDVPHWHVAKPDKDNLEKAVYDALTQMGFFADDSQICDGRTHKIYAMGPAGCDVEITLL